MTLGIFVSTFSEQLAVPLTFSLCLLMAGDALGWSLRGKLAAMGAALGGALAGTLVCIGTSLPSNCFTIPVALVASVWFCQHSGLGWARSAFLLATGAFVCALISYTAILVDATVLREEASALRLDWPGTVAEWVLWVALFLVMGLTKLPRRVLSEMLLSSAAAPSFWRLAWLPATCACAVVVICVPQDMSTLLVNRVIGLAPLLLVAAAAFMTLCYALLWRIINGAAREAAAAKELRLLSLQTLQMRHLQERMGEARRARHDERQHYQALLARAEEGDLEGVRHYLTQWGANRPTETAISYCTNPVANAILVFWCDRASEAGATLDVAVTLPSSFEEAGLSEADVSVVFGNLLENAVEALTAQTAGARSLRERAQMADDGPLFLTVDNSHSGQVHQTPEGRLLSTKHAGEGIGTESVRAVATRLGGMARFEWDERGFCASVMLSRS